MEKSLEQKYNEYVAKGFIIPLSESAREFRERKMVSCFMPDIDIDVEVQPSPQQYPYHIVIDEQSMVHTVMGVDWGLVGGDMATILSYITMGEKTHVESLEFMKADLLGTRSMGMLMESIHAEPEKLSPTERKKRYREGLSSMVKKGKKW